MYIKILFSGGGCLGLVHSGNFFFISDGVEFKGFLEILFLQICRLTTQAGCTGEIYRHEKWIEERQTNSEGRKKSRQRGGISIFFGCVSILLRELSAVIERGYMVENTRASPRFFRESYRFPARGCFQTILPYSLRH